MIPPPPILDTKRTAVTKVKEIRKPEKSVLIISSQHYPFSSWIADNRKFYKVVLTTPEAKADMDFASLKSYDVVETFENYGTNCTVEYRAMELHKKFNFTHVVCLSEEDMIRTSLLRDQFGIKHGQNYESTLRFRDKVIMKTVLNNGGKKVPFFAPIENALDLFSFIEKYGYPIVVKPRRGYGSVNTTVIKTKEELEKFCVTGFGDTVDGPIDMMAESFVNGQMYHVDGFFYDGKARLIWPSRYVNTVVNFSENNFIAGYSLQPSNPLNLRIQTFINDCLVVLDGPSTYPFHAEVWHTPEDELVFCEVASRTGGGGIPTQILSLFGASLSKLHTQYQVDEPITLETKDILWTDRKPIIPESIGWIFIYPKLGKVTMPKNCTDDYVLSYELFAHTGKVYDNRKSCADAVCNFLVKGDTEEEVEKNIFKIYDWFTRNSAWEPIKE